MQFNKKQQSLSYVFENELLNIFSESNHKKLFKSNSNDFPLLLTKLLRNEVSSETIIIMNEFIGFLPKWEETIKDDFIWPKIKHKMFKYRSFLEYDRSKFKTTLLNIVKEFAE